MTGGAVYSDGAIAPGTPDRITSGVNFGVVDLHQVNAPVETFGRGSRGFNVYAGTVNAANSSASSRCAIRDLPHPERSRRTHNATAEASR
jgi:hypothetical protein